VATLNAIRDELTSRYGFREGAPRVNLGPCGRVARDFREAWNARFSQAVTIVFIMAADGVECHHVLIKLPDSRYFDGGNGVVTKDFLQALYPGSHIDEMKQFDWNLLDKRSYSLARSYSTCPNYSDEFTQRVIAEHLNALVKESK
jgi:hypothetical protein